MKTSPCISFSSVLAGERLDEREQLVEPERPDLVRERRGERRVERGAGLGDRRCRAEVAVGERVVERADELARERREPLAAERRAGAGRGRRAALAAPGPLVTVFDADVARDRVEDRVDAERLR